jgi:hypothetical protein
MQSRPLRARRIVVRLRSLSVPLGQRRMVRGGVSWRGGMQSRNALSAFDEVCACPFH